MQCPKCHKEVNLGQQVMDADQEWYESVEPPILLMILCDNCEEPTASVHIDSVVGFDEIVSPALGGKKIKVPKMKK